MKLLVTGVTGTLGSCVFTHALKNHDVIGTARRKLDDRFPEDEFPRDRIVMFDALEDDPVELIDEVQPDVVINCLGIIKQRDVPEDVLFKVNAEFPHALATACNRLIQVSTDCVFSGKKGGYTEEDTPDPVDSYGRSKLEGEVTEPPHLTVRTSLIGFERGTRHSLLEWFLAQEGKVKGYTNAIWSGLSAPELAKILVDLAERDISGLLHVAGEPVSKYELLQLFKKHFSHDVTIVSDDSVRCDRSLAHKRLDELGIDVPSVEEMVGELAGGS